MSDSSSPKPHPLVLDERQSRMLETMGVSLMNVWPSEMSTQALQATPMAADTVSNDVRVAAAVLEPIAAVAREAETNIASREDPSHRREHIQQMGWVELQAAVSQCQACGLCKSRKNTVFGVGQAPIRENQAPEVDWLIVGEAPGENEDIQGEPFVGQAGKLLDNMLAAVRASPQGKALSRQKGAYIANVLKCRPPLNRNPSPNEVAQCEPYLARQIELLRPKIILAMGKFAIQSLTGSMEPVGKLRGRVHELHLLTDEHRKIPVIVTYHPAYLLRNLPAKAQAWSDLLLALTQLERQTVRT